VKLRGEVVSIERVPEYPDVVTIRAEATHPSVKHAVLEASVDMPAHLGEGYELGRRVVVSIEPR
jgi:hypothetical protein